MDFAERFAAHVSPGGHIVLSGILAEQAEQVAACYTPWFSMEPATVKDEWVRLSGKRLD
jgi:ribosomal protein L11 methyltransferase